LYPCITSQTGEIGPKWLRRGEGEEEEEEEERRRRKEQEE